MKTKDIILKTVIALVFVIIAAIVLFIVLTYREHGEEKMPFKISDMTVVSTAEGIPVEGATERWNLEIVQENDFYITIDKDENFGNKEGFDKIEKVEITNIKIQEPNIGEVVMYMPSSKEGKKYEFVERYKVNDTLTFKGSSVTNIKNLEIASNGGQIEFRFVNRGIGSYVSNNDMEEIIHDGTMIAKTSKTMDDLKFKVTFDVIISVEKVKYKTEISVDLPCGDILKDGRSVLEKKEEDFIFKRA